MTEAKRLEQLQTIADTLLEKTAAWVEVLDAEAAGTQTVRHLCATVKDLKDLCRDLAGAQENCLRVIVEGGEPEWNR